MDFRIGLGTDIHILTLGRPLVIGGVIIPSEKGCDGHSDADALIHAVCDALFGALALRDIGFHFPDNNMDYKNINSSILLKKTVRMINDKGYRIQNVDTVIHIEKPKLSDFIPNICKSIADILEVPLSNVSVKAKTAEKTGSVGNGDSIYAIAIVLLMRD